MMGKMPSFFSDTANIILHISNEGLSQIQAGYMFSASWHFNLFMQDIMKFFPDSTGINSIYYDYHIAINSN